METMWGGTILNIKKTLMSTLNGPSERLVLAVAHEKNSGFKDSD